MFEKRLNETNQHRNFDENLVNKCKITKNRTCYSYLSLSVMNEKPKNQLVQLLNFQ